MGVCRARPVAARYLQSSLGEESAPAASRTERARYAVLGDHAGDAMRREIVAEQRVTGDRRIVTFGLSRMRSMRQISASDLSPCAEAKPSKRVASRGSSRMRDDSPSGIGAARQAGATRLSAATRRAVSGSISNLRTRSSVSA